MKLTLRLLETVCLFAGHTPDNSSSSLGASPQPPESSQSVSPKSPSTSSSSSQSPCADSMDTFQIPWNKFPEELMQSLERGKQPSPCMRREIARIVVSEMMKKSSRISKRNSTEVARKMKAKYPKSLQDIIEGDVIGPGYHSLVKQLEYRIDNVKRSTTPKIRQRKHHTDESDTESVPSEQRAAIQDTYECINWDVKFLPLGEPATEKRKT